MRVLLSVVLAVSVLTFTPPGKLYGVDLSEWLTQLVAAETLSADEAAREAKERYGGRVLSVRLEQPEDATPYYRVKLISDGNVRVVEIPAER